MNTLQGETIRFAQESGGGHLKSHEVQQNAYASTANKLMLDASIQGNVVRRNKLQNAMGQVPKVSACGKTIEEIRQIYREGRNEFLQSPSSPEVELVGVSNAAVSNHSYSSSASICSKDKRFYRNNLSESQLTPSGTVEITPAAADFSTFTGTTREEFSPLSRSLFLKPPSSASAEKSPAKCTPPILNKTRKRANKVLLESRDDLSPDTQDAILIVRVKLAERDTVLCTTILDCEFEDEQKALDHAVWLEKRSLKK
eukprot:scaffold464628_cov267-Attheya_sp.AAC.1